MENRPSPFEQTTPQEPESILEDAIDTSDYERTMKNGRIWLYVIAAFQAGVGIFEYVTIDEQTLALVAMGIDVFIAAVFFGCALWSKKKPVPAFTAALIFYILVNGALMALDPTNIYKGIIIKVLVVIALFKANRDARAFVSARNL